MRYLSILFLGLFSSMAQAQLNVFACEPEWAELARELGGEQLEAYSATTRNQDPHHIQARPGLIAKARRADLLLCSGADLEVGWLPLLLSKSANQKIQRGAPGYFMASDFVLLKDKKAHVDRSMGDVHGMGNPHFQLDPGRVLEVAKALTSRLVLIDSTNQNLYQKNLQRFTHEWQASIKNWRQRIQVLKGKTIVVHHNSWLYLVDWLGLKQAGELEPKPGVAPTSGHLSELLRKLKRQPASVIIYSLYQDDRAARWLSDKTGTPALALPSTVAADQSLQEWFDQLIDQLLKASK